MPPAIVIRRFGYRVHEYELVLMLDPEAPDERRDSIAQNARGRIESSGSLKAEKAWGLRKLAYEINQRTEADYRFFRFEAPTAVLDDLDHNLKITDGVMRFRIFKVDPRSPVIEPPPPVALASSAARVAAPADAAAPAAAATTGTIAARDEPAAPRRRGRAAAPRPAAAAARRARRPAAARPPPRRRAAAPAAAGARRRRARRRRPPPTPAPRRPAPSRPLRARQLNPAACAVCPRRGGENAPSAVLDWTSIKRISREG